MEITLYLVGMNEEGAISGLPFDSIESAQSYADDEGGNVYSVLAVIDFGTIRLEADNG
jgi:nitrous oxide reductase accessory protein NosL